MKIRHMHGRSTEIQTMYGKASLDELGYLIDLENPPEDPNDILRNVPDFVDGDLFAAQVQGPTAEELKLLEEMEKTTPFSREDYKKELKFLLEEGAPRNTQGYIDMTYFNAHLRDLRQKIIPGGLRQKLQNELEEEAKAEAETKAEPKKPELLKMPEPAKQAEPAKPAEAPKEPEPVKAEETAQPTPERVEELTAQAKTTDATAKSE